MRSLPWLGALLLTAGPAFAGDGRIEINQDAIDAAGGPPYVISSSGSYVLTSNLRVANLNTDAVQITSSDVSLDLNGFSLVGPATCTGVQTTLTCDAGTGIGVNAISQSRIRVRNGTIRGFAGGGIAQPTAAHISDLIVMENGGVGISVASDSVIRDCVSYRNGNSGMLAVGSSVVADSVASGNRYNGINLNAGSVVTGSTVVSNGQDGVGSNNFSTLVLGNVIYSNTTKPINTSNSTTWGLNAINFNGSAPSGGANLGNNGCGASICP